MIKESVYRERAEQAAVVNGYEFVGWDGDFINNKTNCIFFCERHGSWVYKKLACLTKEQKIYCPGCWQEYNRKSDVEMTNIFLQNKTFHRDTKFKRSDRKTKEGKQLYWQVSCPECGEVNEALVGGLRRGCLPCRCGRHKQIYGYIYSVSISDTVSCLKYGVTNDPKRRLDEHVRNNLSAVLCVGIWKFQTKSDCYGAERDCRKYLTHYQDKANILAYGQTEIVGLDELAKIVAIYESWGGISIGCSPSE